MLAQARSPNASIPLPYNKVSQLYNLSAFDLPSRRKKIPEASVEENPRGIPKQEEFYSVSPQCEARVDIQIEYNRLAIG